VWTASAANLPGRADNELRQSMLGLTVLEARQSRKLAPRKEGGAPRAKKGALRESPSKRPVLL
jgi:hypothetical protein